VIKQGLTVCWSDEATSVKWLAMRERRGWRRPPGGRFLRTGPGQDRQVLPTRSTTTASPAPTLSHCHDHHSLSHATTTPRRGCLPLRARRTADRTALQVHRERI